MNIYQKYPKKKSYYFKKIISREFFLQRIFLERIFFKFLRAVMVQGIDRLAPISMFRGSNPSIAKSVFLHDFEVLVVLAPIRALQCYNFGLVILSSNIPCECGGVGLACSG
jgi:hypothetical protein